MLNLLTSPQYHSPHQASWCMVTLLLIVMFCLIPIRFQALADPSPITQPSSSAVLISDSQASSGSSSAKPRRALEPISQSEVNNTSDINNTSDTDHALVIGKSPGDPALQGRARGSINAQEVREQVARSTPEALGEEVGAYVQQTAHGQGSVYLRGRTGRHTLLMVDGFRLNHALFRQGPNQYLFTIDPLSLSQIEILRGGGAVTLGANALAGAILVTSKRPPIDPTSHGVKTGAIFSLLHTTADLSRGASEAWTRTQH